MAISFTPATCAGITFIKTVDGYAALPPGIYTPTLSSGLIICPRRLPFSENDHDSSFCISWNARILLEESLRAFTTFASAFPAYLDISSGLILNSFTFRESKALLYFRTALLPFFLTSSRMALTLCSIF